MNEQRDLVSYPERAVKPGQVNAMGLVDAEYYTVLFGFARIAGIAAQIVEERLKLRGGRGIPIYRPKYLDEDQPKRRLT